MHKRILILRPGAIGDALLTFPILQALRTHYSQAHITFVSNPAVLPLARVFGLADEISDYGSFQWSELFSTTGIRNPALRDLLHHTDDAICWLRDPDGIVKQNLRSAGIQQVTITPGRPPEGNGIHVVDYLAETIGIHINIETVLVRPGRPAHLASSHSQRIAIHPGSGGAHKCWPVPRFATIVRELWHRQIPVLLLAGPADAERLSDLLSLIASPPDPSLLTLLVNAPLLEVAEHLQHCRGYLGNDSGVTHLSALLGTPTITLFGPSDPAIWHPVGPRAHVIYEPVLEHLQIHVVMNVIHRVFIASSHNRNPT